MASVHSMRHQHVLRDRLIQRCEASDRERSPVVHPAGHIGVAISRQTCDIVGCDRALVPTEIGRSFARMFGKAIEQRCSIHGDEVAQVDTLRTYPPIPQQDRQRAV